MATIGYYEPRIVGNGSIKEPVKFMVNPAQGAAWRRGDIVVQATTGTITALPTAGQGALATAAIPGSSGASAVTITNSASSGAPAQTYFIALTYTATSAESQPAYFVQNCPPGYIPTITVASAGAPSGATNFAAYVGLLPGYYSLQQASKTTTALGSAFNVAYPLTNSAGANRGATNLSGSILGLADSMSDETYFDGYGGSFTAGRAGSRLGSTNTIAPLTPTEAPLLYVVGLGNGQRVELNLVNTTAWSPYLLGTTAGLALDSSTGFFVVDPGQSNKIVTIVDQRPGVYIGPTASGTAGDLGARVVVEFSSSSLLIQ